MDSELENLQRDTETGDRAIAVCRILGTTGNLAELAHRRRLPKPHAQVLQSGISGRGAPHTRRNQG